jgi:hypothetical protein
MEGKNPSVEPVVLETLGNQVKAPNGIWYNKKTYGLMAENKRNLDNWQTNVNKNPVTQQFGTYPSGKGGSYRRSTKRRKSIKRRKSSKRRKGTKRRK